MRDFWKDLPEPPSEYREELILKAIEEGRHDPVVWSPLKIGLEEGVDLLLSVASDALKIDGKRINVTMTTMQKIVDLLGCAFPTSRISDLIYTNADVTVDACLQKPDACMAYTSRCLQHSDAIETKMCGRFGLVSTVGKDWVLTNKLVGKPDKSANYGWHDPAAAYTSPGHLKLWQNVGTAHDRWHTDYSQVVRLVSRNCLLNEEQMDLMDLLTTHDLAYLLSYEGNLSLSRMPGVPVYRTPASLTPHVAGDTLGERCVAWCLQYVGHTEQPPGSNDSSLIRKWLAPCARGYDDKRVVLGLSKMNWCFTGDTEILTDQGWLRFDLLEDSDKVAQVDPKTLLVSLVQPEALIHKKHEGPLVVVDRQAVHLVSDPEHRYFGRWMISSRELGAEAVPDRELRPISDLLGKGSQVNVPTPSGTEGKGVAWEDRDLKLLAAFLADGSLVKGRIQIQVSRPDKIAMLEALVPDRSWTASKAYGPRSKKPLTSFFFSTPPDFSACWSSYKILSSEFLWSLDKRQAALLLDTVAQYDGSARGGSTVISQSSKERTDMLQILAVLAGYPCQTRKPRRAGEFGSTMSALAYIRYPRNTLITKDNVRETESTQADLYCVRVPKGLIVVRSPGYGRALVVGNCSAMQCAAMQACLRPGEAPPHDYRAGVVELVEDTYPGRDGKVPFAGCYKPIELTLEGKFFPAVGDLAIFDRSIRARPETSWYRHVSRVIRYGETTGIFQTVGGNEDQQVRVQEHHVSQDRLLGWIHYPQPEQPTPAASDFSEYERRQIQSMVGAFLRRAADEIWKGPHRL